MEQQIEGSLKVGFDFGEGSVESPRVRIQSSVFSSMGTREVYQRKHFG